ncbi:MAG: MBL fold metallo-hydrolase [Pseudomonadota bacterium]
MKKVFLSALALLVLAAAGAWVFRAPLSMEIAGMVAAKRLASDALDDLPDGLHVGLCGAGSPFPDDKRAGPCNVVVAGKQLFIVDAGSGSVRNIGRMGFNHGRIGAVFLTHFHSDHIDGLGELMLQRWVSMANARPVNVYGPDGVEQVIGGFMQAYSQDQHYRVTHHGEETMPPGGFGGKAMTFTPGPDGRVVLLKDQYLEITAFTVDHGPVHPAIGYRFIYKGRSIVISGDTKKSAAVQREAAGVDVLVHEALSAPLLGILKDAAIKANRPKLGKIFDDIINYHASPEEAAETARNAKAGYLLLNHIAPPLPVPGMEKAFLGNAASIYSGPIRVGIDGDFVSLPAGSSAINYSRRF